MFNLTSTERATRKPGYRIGIFLFLLPGQRARGRQDAGNMVASASPDQLLRVGMQGQMILAPLTRGGNLPFRRLCADFGMRVGVGEMVFARMLLNDDKKEKARLRRAANEGLFGVQIATNDVEEGVRAVALAAEAGADWVDLNCGCPIYVRHHAFLIGQGDVHHRLPPPRHNG